MKIKERLNHIEERDLLPSSFDIIGNKEKAVAIVEINEKIEKYALKIANAIMEEHKNVKTVLRKKSPRKGKYRLYDLEIITGDKNTEVIHVENGYRIKIDPIKTYFSVREGTERMRICKLIKPKERVMIFFAGAGPYAIAISKYTKASEIVGIEINPEAVNYFKENIMLNKCKNTTVVEGDVKKIAENYKNFDHVFMPLPESSIEFIKYAMNCLKKNGIMHIYTMDDEKKVSQKLKSLGIKFKIIGKQKISQYAPHIWKLREDVEIC